MSVCLSVCLSRITKSSLWLPQTVGRNTPPDRTGRTVRVKIMVEFRVRFKVMVRVRDKVRDMVRIWVKVRVMVNCT